MYPPRMDAQEEMIALIRHLLDKAERGEPFSAALRIRLHDGSGEEIVIGDTEEDRTALMSKLRRMLGELH